MNSLMYFLARTVWSASASTVSYQMLEKVGRFVETHTNVFTFEENHMTTQ